MVVGWDYVPLCQTGFTAGTDTGCVGATDQCFQQTAGLSGGGKKKKYKKRRTQRKKRSKGKKTKGKKTKGKKTRDYKCKSCKRKTCKCNNKHTKRNRKTRRNL